MKVLQFVCLVLLLNLCNSARILGIIPTPSYSHQVVFQPLWKELSLRGHLVTVFTTNPIMDPSLKNLTEIDLSFSYKFLHENLSEIINASGRSVLKPFTLSLQSFANAVDAQLQHPKVQNIINDPAQHFDLIIAEYFFVAPIYLYKKFKCPYIGVISLDPPNTMYQEFGSISHPIVYPNQFVLKDGELNVFNRVYLIFMEVLVFFVLDMYAMQEQIAKKHFNDTTPARTVLQDASLIFVNTDPVFHYVRPLLPSIIPIGGSIARISVKPLEKNIKKFLDEAHEGFIYFSLGSNVKGKDIPKRTMGVVLETFQQIPYKVLWKYEDDDLVHKPNNVIISKWVSQMEVLRHPNIKLFITHGGAQSMEETISAKIPIVGMPFFVDQPHNIKRMVQLGCGLSVNYRDMTTEVFRNAILEVTNNNRYRKRISELADLASDQPMTGLERAVWWTEYVIRHKGAAHFRSPALDMPWYQYYLLDVVGVVLITILIFFWIVFLIVKHTMLLLQRIFKKIKLKKS